jgi:hypothetical protein
MSRKTHSKTSARSLPGAEAAEIAVDRAEKSSKMPGKQVDRPATPENNSEGVIVPNTPRAASLGRALIQFTTCLRHHSLNSRSCPVGSNLPAPKHLRGVVRKVLFLH